MSLLSELFHHLEIIFRRIFSRYTLGFWSVSFLRTKWCGDVVFHYLEFVMKLLNWGGAGKGGEYCIFFHNWNYLIERERRNYEITNFHPISSPFAPFHTKLKYEILLSIFNHFTYLIEFLGDTIKFRSIPNSPPLSSFKKYNLRHFEIVT